MNKTENMAAMLLTLTQSDEWFRLCDSDEGIKEANDNLQIMIDKLAADNPDEMMVSCGRLFAVSVTLAAPLPCSTASGLPTPSAMFPLRASALPCRPSDRAGSRPERRDESSGYQSRGEAFPRL